MGTRNRSRIVVVGTAGVDLKGKPTHTPVGGTSNPGEIRISVGGCARNIAENLARLGASVSLLTAIGADDFGRLIRERTDQAGVDLSRITVHPSLASASYLAIVNMDGTLAMSIDDMRIVATIDSRWLRQQRTIFEEATWAVVDANLTRGALQTFFKLADQTQTSVCANPVSLGLSLKIKPWLSHCRLVVCNQFEARVLTETHVDSRSSALTAAHKMVGMGVDIAVISLESLGLVYATSESSGYVPAIAVEVYDRTGGGDALTAAIVYGLVNGIPVDECVRLGVSAASLTITSKETVCPELSLENLYQTMVI